LVVHICQRLPGNGRKSALVQVAAIFYDEASVVVVSTVQGGGNRRSGICLTPVPSAREGASAALFFDVLDLIEAAAFDEQISKRSGKPEAVAVEL
jgi:hypothetical protein